LEPEQNDDEVGVVLEIAERFLAWLAGPEAE
jgi:hypothetical protein